MTLNGWLYVNGNPVNLVDPSGHSFDRRTICTDSECFFMGSGRNVKPTPSPKNDGNGRKIDKDDDPPAPTFTTPNPYDGPYGAILFAIAPIDIEPTCVFVNGGQAWKDSEKKAILEAAERTGQAFADELNKDIYPGIAKLAEHGIYFDFYPLYTSSSAFLEVYGGQVTAKREDDVRNWGAEITGTNEITYYNVQLWTENEKGKRVKYAVDYDYTAGHVGHTVHELGHLFDNRTLNNLRSDMTGDLAVTEGDRYRGFPPPHRIGGGRYSSDTAGGEVFADMFYIWVMKDNIFGPDTDYYAGVREQHMSDNMYDYIQMAILGP